MQVFIAFHPITFHTAGVIILCARDLKVRFTNASRISVVYHFITGVTMDIMAIVVLLRGHCALV